MLYAAGGPRGGLTFLPEVKDWDTKLNLSGIHGSALLRAWILRADGNEKNPIPFRDALGAKDRPNEVALYQEIFLDDTAPEKVLFVNLPEYAVRGATLDLAAKGEDLESDIKEVLFFPGKPLPDGKAPLDVTRKPGKPIDKERPKEKVKDRSWVTSMFIPSDQPGLLTVSVQFINNVGLSTIATTQLPVVDQATIDKINALKAQEKKKASIKGKVLEGDRPQEGLTVQLLNDSGKVVATAKTDTKGEFLFKNLDPGAYKVTASKSSSRTKGEEPASVTEGENKTGVEIKLLR
jgi:hypothetical protein